MIDLVQDDLTEIEADAFRQRRELYTRASAGQDRSSGRFFSAKLK